MGGSKSSEKLKKKQKKECNLLPYILSLLLFASYIMIVIGYFHFHERNQVLYQKIYTLEKKNHYLEEALTTLNGKMNNWIRELQRLSKDTFTNITDVNTSLNLLQKEFPASHNGMYEERLYGQISALQYSKDVVNRKIMKIQNWIPKVDLFMKSSFTNITDFNTSLILLQKRIVDNNFQNWGASIVIDRLQSQFDDYKHRLQNISRDFLSGCQLEIRYTESIDSDPPSTSNLTKKTTSQWQCAAYRTGPLVQQEDMKWIVRNFPVRICIKCE